MEQFEKKYKEILACVNQASTRTNKAGLISGDIGILLLNLHSCEYFRNDTLFHNTVEDIDTFIENIVIEENYASYCYGLAGFGFFIEYIEQKGWIEIDTNDVLEALDNYLHDKMMSFIEKGNYDFLHGAIGIGFYFIKRSRKNLNAKKYLKDLILTLESQSIDDGNGGLKWNLFEFKNNSFVENEYNIGLSHGIPSIMVFLLKAHNAGILPEKTLMMANSTVKFIMSTKLNNSLNFSAFPDYIYSQTDGKPSTRLAWCYGDLGVCCALWQAANTFDNQSLREEVLKIMQNAATRLSYESTGIKDAGLCHGTAGAAHIFQRFYDWTNDATFKIAADYWYNVILEKATFEDGYAGFKTHSSTEFGGDVTDASFLEGISGIGLTLLYKISGIDPSWEELLFIR